MIANKHSDTVLCSAGKGELKREDCLACAKTINNSAALINSSVKAILDDRTALEFTSPISRLPAQGLVHPRQPQL